MDPTPLFRPLKAGALALPNRIVMAPLTRMRADAANAPHALNARYYAQRAGAGLIISEATQILPEGMGYPATPGIHSEAQVAGWRLVTDAVHAAGGRIALQLWHVGRISHRSLQPNGQLPVAPSAIAAEGGTLGPDWKPVPFETPRALEASELPDLVAAYRHAAENAKRAGFDAVEVHGANGYLLDQFLQDGSNHRTDVWGGSIANRARLLLEVIDAAAAAFGHDRVGVRLSPYGTFNSMHDSDPVALFNHVCGEIAQRGLAWAHLIEPRASNAGGGDELLADAPSSARLFRAALGATPLISAGGYTPESAAAALADGTADAIAFGRLYIANPDLAERLRRGAALNRYDRSTFYGGGEQGYTDYPALA